MTDIIGAITGVFEAIGNWIVGFIPDVVEMFWYTPTNGTPQLTFIGILTLMGLGMSIFFLIVGLVSNFLHFGR